MLSSLCPVLAVISSVSRFCVTAVALQNPGPRTADALVMRVGGDSRLASVQLAGSIASWIVARLFWMNAVRAAPSRPAGATAARRRAAKCGAAGQGQSRKEPPVAGARLGGEGV